MNGARPSRPVTPAYLERAALAYLERYSSSADNLRRVLARKARRRLGPEAEMPPSLEGDIATVVERTVRSGLLDDASFAEGRVAAMSRKGASPRAMRQRLRQKGIADGLAAQTIAASEPDEMSLARRHLQRKRLGPFRNPPDPARRDQDLASLCRAGFSYGTARRALDEPAEEAPLP